MADFHISIMFVGILLMAVSLVWIAFDKKKESDDKEVLEEKKETLVSVISDAELMIEELNNISDYLVSHIDKKRQEVMDTMKEANEKIKEVKDKKIREIIDKEIKSATSKKIKEILDKEIKTLTSKKIQEIIDKEIKEIIAEIVREMAEEEIESINEKKIAKKTGKVYFTEAKEPLIDDNSEIFRNVLSEDTSNALSDKIERERKIVSLNSKYKEVISLSQSGFNETQIAKKLNMGKGEIQLVLGINK
ncbi:DUF6115 domain-containing protein [Acetivibrio saccincola]|uniref:Uncharacterized protein n=1 Tax=Acetivibrio saccincola TaxID=1677857 RepID=A0A2K9ECS9_9FIRM|nr:hypothetical protein [Acetivibrio saccincola]AUG57944.1 hypothetical protein HVS_10245 [Acetivibrio saccincola]PQQ67838.1 hypothetical protein B9R14_14475 [Acetivibrio saccincola]